MSKSKKKTNKHYLVEVMFKPVSYHVMALTPAQAKEKVRVKISRGIARHNIKDMFIV